MHIFTENVENVGSVNHFAVDYIYFVLLSASC